MFVTLLALLSKRSDDISQRTQALIDILRLPQPFFMLPSPARIQPLAASKVDKIQRAFAYLAGVRVRAADAQREDGMRTRGPFVHQSCRDCAIARRERTWAGERSCWTTTSVMRVDPFSCLISCFFLSNSPFPRRSL